MNRHDEYPSGTSSARAESCRDFCDCATHELITAPRQPKPVGAASTFAARPAARGCMARFRLFSLAFVSTFVWFVAAASPAAASPPASAPRSAGLPLVVTAAFSTADKTDVAVHHRIPPEPAYVADPPCELATGAGFFEPSHACDEEGFDEQAFHRRPPSFAWADAAVQWNLWTSGSF